ncbi:thiamine phosphate synthase [Avibacterium paragallinarum]|uniref:Thiamine-phosphate synthase n=1 Tax=Avibacterium paragallinarum TaxID=728 RepID=A0A377IB37_AVIPA|nr:thiamine phosphate synthase [Avibacterium paragallinarum]POY46320.1 thiamine phosphate synthase [Avibacterium paragallinarum]RZN59009.1 thiamine phosphate synthase [Avibacterium paragallinarum]RZN75472.1 thiamine phosphate synthase [Avibacterium paragallinarum]TID11913.1 thiamine-phosphate pyrophosphorylase [Avibacterium paragallinarum]STO71969.1 thiamine-phosphate pyrophosphorylase [Avibacterium paragallinarum]
MDKSILRCYLVAGTQDCRHFPTYASNPQQALLTRLEQALQAGITCYQFREKGQFSLQDPQQIEQLARQCQALCQQYNVPFIMNNDVALAEKLNADGIHVGQKDTAVEQLAQRLQGEMLIGLSVNTLAQAQRHNDFNGVDYYGCGPIFPTFSKADASPDVGIDFVHYLRQQGINKPLVAIGGIKTEHVAPLLQAGADGMAVISTIMQSKNLISTVQKILGE